MELQPTDEQRLALSLGWTVDRVSLFDEEGVDGWRWTEPDGTEHVELGDWNDPPPWPESARLALQKHKK